MTNQKVTDTATSLGGSLDAAMANSGSTDAGIVDVGLVDGIETLQDTVINVVRAYPNFIKSAPFCCCTQLYSSKR